MNLTKFLKVKMIVNYGLNDTFKIKDHKRHEVYVIHFLDKNYLADNQFFTRPITSQRLQFSQQELCWDGFISNNKSLSWHLGKPPSAYPTLIIVVSFGFILHLLYFCDYECIHLILLFIWRKLLIPHNQKLTISLHNMPVKAVTVRPDGGFVFKESWQQKWN